MQLEDVRLTFRTRDTALRALNGASLTIQEGEAVGLVGESGSGKSTLARAVLGLNPERSSKIEAGRILIAGRDVTRLSQAEWESERGHPVAMVFQDPLSFLNPIMRVGRQIAESIERHTPERAGRASGSASSSTSSDCRPRSLAPIRMNCRAACASARFLPSRSLASRAC